jgi:DoxX-like protein
MGRRGGKETIRVLIAADVTTGVLALVFLAAGLQKLARAQQQVATAQRLRIPWGRFRLIALPEIAASLGLAAGYAVMPLGAAAAAGLTLLMVGAIVSRLRVRDSAAFVLGDLTFLGAAAAVAALRLTAA